MTQMMFLVTFRASSDEAKHNALGWSAVTALASIFSFTSGAGPRFTVVLGVGYVSQSHALARTPKPGITHAQLRENRRPFHANENRKVYYARADIFFCFQDSSGGGITPTNYRGSRTGFDETNFPVTENVRP